MKFQDLRIKAADYPLFSFIHVIKWFPNNKEGTIKQNLKFWIKKKLIERIIKGVYKLSEAEIKDEFLIASYLNEVSYISLESALSYYGMISEYPYAITSITIKKTKKFKTRYGIFLFRKIKKELFFGFKIVSGDNYFYRLATPEKALFDFIYLNQKTIKSPDYFKEMRLSFPEKFDFKKLKTLLLTINSIKIIDFLEIYVINS